MKKQKKKDAREQSTRQLMGIDGITDYSVATRMGELVFSLSNPRTFPSCRIPAWGHGSMPCSM